MEKVATKIVLIGSGGQLFSFKKGKQLRQTGRHYGKDGKSTRFHVNDDSLILSDAPNSSS